ncbi:MAG: hypothetical protein NUV86_10355 [Candidatus Scalindua sp.]|nr:hypothetical protein [Candidatus Scalindua sp.]MCR4345185.1 hypothetical protein [Candidatus Scalindua sp.]
MTASIRTLNIFAAFVWYIGGIVLLIKGTGLLVEAYSLKPEQYWPWLAVAVGPAIGIIKGKFIFRKSCLKNLARINAINQPKIWQFFKPWFFAVLAIMIVFGAAMARLAHTQHSYYFLIAVSIVDIDIGIALLWSSYIFWKQKAFVK